MRNIKLTIEYDGKDFSGWQFQKNKRTVQDVLQKALSTILHEKVVVICAGRTDSGVHALGQVASFRTNSVIDLDKLRLGANALMPEDVAIRELKEVPVSFHAQKSARGKRYRYVIINDRGRPVLERGRCWHIWDHLDAVRMKRAARLLVGRKDFSSFRSTDPQDKKKSGVRKIISAKVWRRGRHIYMEFVGQGFLKYMVRNIVGTIVEVSRGRVGIKEFAGIIKAKDRKKAKVTAPAYGLFLMEVF